MATTISKLYPTGVLQTTVELDEVTYSSIKMSTGGIYAAEFDENTLAAGTAERRTSTGSYQVSGYFDELNTRILESADLYLSPATTLASTADNTTVTSLVNLGLSRTIYNATNATTPPVVATQNSVKVLSFNDITRLNLQLETEIDLSTSCSAFFVGYPTGIRMIALGGATSTGNDLAFLGYDGGTNTVIFRNSTDAGQTLNGLSSVSGLKAFGIIQGTSTFSYYDNSTTPVAGTFSSGTYKFKYLGFRDGPSPPGQYSTGYLGDVVVFKRVLTTEEAGLVMLALKSKYNIT